MSEKCIFCRIVAGEEVAEIVWRDGNVTCFFPRTKYVKGHTLIVPNRHFENIFDMPAETSSALMGAAKFLSVRYRNILGCDGINLMHASGKAAQQSVFHFHIHLVPRFNNDGLDSMPSMPRWNGDRAILYEVLRDGFSGKDT